MQKYTKNSGKKTVKVTLPVKVSEKNINGKKKFPEETEEHDKDEIMSLE